MQLQIVVQQSFQTQVLVEDKCRLDKLLSSILGGLKLCLKLSLESCALSISRNFSVNIFSSFRFTRIQSQ
jgi:hypothetical protein